MLTYFNDEIKTKIQELLAFYTEHRMDYEFFDLDNPEEYEEDIIVCYDSKISFGLPHCDDDYFEHTLGEMFEILEEIKNAKIIDNYVYISTKRLLVRVDTLNREKLFALQDKAKGVFQTSLTMNQQTFHIDLVSEHTNFGILVTVMDNYDKYFPPILYEDLFIEITSEKLISLDQFEDLMQAYMFELSSTLDIKLFISPRPIYYDLEYVLQEGDEKARLRPLVTGRGNKELYQIYNSCANIEDAEILILMYTKVIEFVTQTVVRRELLDSVMTKLYSPKTLSPDAVYVLELERIFDDLGNYKKDKEAIRITIETCCEVLELKGSAPKFLRNLNKVNIESTREEKKQALLELSNAISDTRNMIAHAKTNYKNKGNECPKEEMKEFSDCLKIIADQVIRWFSRQHEDLKVI
ncbi:hypothetical protein MHB84_05425 [Paenibacillus sp. FSL F4-0087]|uniref:hypothetical protein n=1 Tax=Paenibacillus sp. FSL F4-0087 TaxID=2921368 RepID=UPI00096E0C72|nr:hypothetical protein BK122_27445 [Paenibacillus pabuli]